MYNVLFPSGKIKSYYVKSVAEMYCQIYNGIMLGNPLDSVSMIDYNDSIVNEMEAV